MNVLFLTLLDFTSIQEHTIYTDLLREFHKNGHHVYAVSPVERRKIGRASCRERVLQVQGMSRWGPGQ